MSSRKSAPFALPAPTDLCSVVVPSVPVPRAAVVGATLVAGLGLVACGEEESMCPAELPEVMTSCTVSGCTATTGTRTVALADLDAADADRWLVIAYAGSELFDNQIINLEYTEERAGALTARRADARSRYGKGGRHRESIEQAWGTEAYESVFGPHRRSRVEVERRLRAANPQRPLSLAGVTGTAIRGRTAASLPPDVQAQQSTCSQAAPACGAAALCVIPSGATEGTCESRVTIKFRPMLDRPSMFEPVEATVRAVGTFGAIVVDDADMARLTDEDVATLSDRFERRIAPLDHAFFGRPVDDAGNDRDGNGVVILFFTSRVAQLGSNLVGFFQSLDLSPVADAPASNEADILFLQPPGPQISLDQLSGTIGHEYQHLINFYTKVINRGSSPETVWLDEGLSTFAEDMLGYGSDAFRNVAAYLTSVSDTSLTGFGLINTNEREADSLERRGAAHLLVRYFFEQAGGAQYDDSDPGAITDNGGVAAVRQLVSTADTGIDAFADSGRSFSAWIRDLLTVVAIDGANIPDVSCNPSFTLEAPETDAFTGFQRGLDLRTPIAVTGGVTIPLNGPMTLPFEALNVPVPLNGGEIRTLDTPSGVTRIGLLGPVDEDVTLGLRILPGSR